MGPGKLFPSMASQRLCGLQARGESLPIRKWRLSQHVMPAKGPEGGHSMPSDVNYPGWQHCFSGLVSQSTNVSSTRLSCVCTRFLPSSFSILILSQFLIPLGKLQINYTPTKIIFKNRKKFFLKKNISDSFPEKHTWLHIHNILPTSTGLREGSQ